MNKSYVITSFDLQAEMGIFKKPDTNNNLCLTFNMLHKPAFLGILGAIVGLSGYKEWGMLPEYYVMFNHLHIGIQPIGSINGFFQKTFISFNNSTGMASNEKGGNLTVSEQVLINPAYRCYVMLDTNDPLEKSLLDNILKSEAVYLPYMGKNEYYAWWDNAKVYDDYKPFDYKRKFRVANLFRKKDAVSGHVARAKLDFTTKKSESSFFFFERLPVGFDENLHQYSYGDFVYSNAYFDPDADIVDRSSLYDLGDETIVQLL